MKKMLLTALMVLMASAQAFAGSGIKVVQGNKKVFKEAKGTAVVEVVLDGASYDDRMPLEKKFADLASFRKIAIEGFSQDFNDESKKVKIVDSAEAADYKITIKVKKVDQYFKVTGFIPSNATKVWSTVTISDASGKVVTVVEANAVDGGANPSPDGTISDSFEELGEKIAKLK